MLVIDGCDGTLQHCTETFVTGGGVEWDLKLAVDKKGGIVTCGRQRLLVEIKETIPTWDAHTEPCDSQQGRLAGTVDSGDGT